VSVIRARVAMSRSVIAFRVVVPVAPAATPAGSLRIMPTVSPYPPIHTHRAIAAEPTRVGPRMAAHVDDTLWDEFHSLVNMTSRELRDWLATDDAHEDSEPVLGPVGTPTGRAVLGVLGKRRTDLTETDLATMRRVVDRVRAARGDEPEPTAGQPAWRRRPMRMGHDPLKAVGG
jgi:Protein of unknown function (DUF3140)